MSLISADELCEWFREPATEQPSADILSADELCEWVSSWYPCISRICVDTMCLGYHDHTDLNIQHAHMDTSELCTRWVLASNILTDESRHRKFVEDVQAEEYHSIVCRYLRYFNHLRRGVNTYLNSILTPPQIDYNNLGYSDDRISAISDIEYDMCVYPYFGTITIDN